MHAKAAGVGVLSSASLTSLSVSLPYVALLRLPVGVPVVVGQRHVLQPVVLGCGWGRVGHAVGLVGQAVGGAEALAGADGAGPLARVLWVQALPIEAILFGSAGRERGQRLGGCDGWAGGRERMTTCPGLKSTSV